MAITAYEKEVTPGTFKTLYSVTAEAINRYTGKRVQKSRKGILSKPKAEIIYRELWNICREERPDDASVTHWGEIVDKYINHSFEQVRSPRNPHGLSPKVARYRDNRLAHTKSWREMHIDLITPKFVTDQLNEFEINGFSRTQTNHILQEVKAVFNFGIHLGSLKFSPFAGMKMRKIPKKRKEALNHAEVDKLLSEAKLRNHPYYWIWLLTISLGLRRSELAGLKWLDVDFEQGLIYLSRQKIPGEGVIPFLKDREERVVSIPSRILPVLKEMKLRSNSEFVIEIKCMMWRKGYQSVVLRNFCREIGIKEVTHHQLRATHITLALIDGVPLGIVKENVGHAKLSTTDTYFRSSGIQMKGQMDSLRISVPQDQPAEVISIKKSK